jgi:hypothetical protein
VPLDILKKSPKLYAAYESRLPELSSIAEDVGHVLVHYLHTGAYQSLKPKPTDPMSKQICELKTSIQAYAAARAYDLPDLMRLAEAKIAKYGEGLPLPALLEVARDAYPTLTEGDDWFLDYLRSRIRPHLKDPKSLLGSNLLDQISNILSPNRVLLRTVLELFCERIAVRPESVTSPAESTIASPITSPGSSRPVSPLPPASPMSTLEMRSRAILPGDLALARKNLKATPWPSPDNMSEASWARSASPDPVLSETAPPQFEAKPVPIPQPALGAAPFADLGPVIVDVVPPPGPSIQAKTTVDHDAKPAMESEVEVAVEPEIKPPVESEDKEAAEIETVATTEPEVKQEEPAIPDPVPVAQRERKDSGKGIDLEPLPKELESIPELAPELETESSPQPKVQRRMLREADSGFWEGPDVMDSSKELAPSIVEIEPAVAPAPEPAHELESVADPKGVPGVEARDFASPAVDAKSTTDREADAGREASIETVSVRLPAQEPASEAAAETMPKDAPESESAPEPQPIKTEEAPEKADEVATLIVPDITPAEVLPEETQSKEAEAQPETEKVEPLPSCPEQESLLTIQQIQEEAVEPEAVAKPEPEPKTDSSDPVPLPDDAQPAGSSEPQKTEPSLEPGPKPAGKPEVQRANTDSAVHAALGASIAKSSAVLSAKPAPQQEGAKTEADAANVQPCSAQVRQRSWKKRFLSLRYPVLFGRGM